MRLVQLTKRQACSHAVCCRELPPWEYKDYLGWQEQGDGKLAYGVFVQSGRVKVRYPGQK